MTMWTDLSTIDHCLTFVDAGGVSTRALQAGEDGEPWILLHGTTGHLDCFTRVVADLSALGRVHAIDMLGHGYTDKPDGPYTIPRYVQHVIDYMDAVGADTVNVLGQSLGGWVGAWLASEHPDRVRRLVLAAPGGTAAVPETMERIRNSTLEAVHDDEPEATRARLDWLFFDPDRSTTDELVQVRHAIYRGLRETIQHILCLQQMETRQQNLLREERLAEIKAPTLFVRTSDDPTGGGEEDTIWSSTIPDCKTVVVEQCGHWPQWEQPQVLMRHVRSFVDRQ